MSTTTALDLLALADVQTRRLRDTDLAATASQWESFDVTLHRLLLELTGAEGVYVSTGDPSRTALRMAARTYPRPLRFPINTQLHTRQVATYLNAPRRQIYQRVHRGDLQAVKEHGQLLFASASIDEHPHVRPADPTDPHPLARASCALGALADLIRDSRDHGPAVLQRDGEVAGAVLHVLSLAAVATRHTLAHGPLTDALRPLHIGRYAEGVIDSLRDAALQPASLDRLAAVNPAPMPSTLNDRLEAAIHAWHHTARRETGRLVPSIDVLRQIANQGAHLCTVRALTEADPDSPTVETLRRGAEALARGEKAWDKLTTLTRPGHDFVTSSRDLYEALRAGATATRASDPTFDRPRAQADLDRGLGTISNLMSATRTLPDQLLAAAVLRAPAAAIRATDDRLRDAARGRYTRVCGADAPDLSTAWANACAQTLSVAHGVEPMRESYLSLGAS